MKSVNDNKNLWTSVSVEELETREEYAACISWCFDCIILCFVCFSF